MTDQQQPPPPLWRVMRDATHAAMNKYHPFCTDEQSYAAELRAIADAVVPDHLCIYGESFDIDSTTKGEIRQLLLAEADRAEQGEVE